jgi:hypothetical protein
MRANQPLNQAGGASKGGDSTRNRFELNLLRVAGAGAKPNSGAKRAENILQICLVKPISADSLAPLLICELIFIQRMRKRKSVVRAAT